METIEELKNKSLWSSTGIIIDKCAELVRILEKNTNGVVTLPNIGITYNNKLVELIHIYKRKNMDFHKSLLGLVIQRFLLDLLSKALKCLESYTMLIEERVSISNFEQQAKSIVEEAEEFLVAYRKIDKKIFDFEIERDILLAVKNDVEYFSKVGQEGGYNLYQNEDGIVGGYNQELKSLGYNISIPEELLFTNISDQPQLDTSDIKQLTYQQMELIRLQFKDTPIIVTALESQLLDYLDEGAQFYQQGDMSNYELSCRKIQQFNAEGELVESLGKYVAYWSDVNKFHHYDEFENIKDELRKIGMGGIISQIEQDVANNKYQPYIEYRNKLLEQHSIEEDVSPKF